MIYKIYEIIFFFQFSVINPHLKTRSKKTAVHCPREGGSLYKRDFFSVLQYTLKIIHHFYHEYIWYFLVWREQWNVFKVIEQSPYYTALLIRKVCCAL